MRGPGVRIPLAAHRREPLASHGSGCGITMYAIFEHAIFDEPIEWFLAAARTLLVRLTQFIVEQERIRLWPPSALFVSTVAV
jgi:hypothetical protein